MKFRHFEFKLFPKLKNKKKKKQPKLCNPDFPRDIGLDKNFNYSKTSFQGYYDNLGVDDNFLTRQFMTSEEAHFGNSRYRTYPLPELKIEVGSLCQCERCIGLCQADHRSSTWICVSSPEEDQTGSDASVGTPNTIPRTRTRIKTNPWLPSPRATPSPSSPSDPADSILYSSSEFIGSTQSCPINLSRSREENNPFHWPCNTAQSYTPLRSECSGFHSLVQIAELENDSNEDDAELPGFGASTSITAEVVRIRKTRTQSIEQMTLDFIKETEVLSSHSSDSNGKKRFSFTEFLKYDTDGSTCTSPSVDTIEFLSTIKYDVDFDYENRMDELLETSDFPRDATFVSIKELLDDVNERDYANTDRNVNGNIQDINISSESESTNKCDSLYSSENISLNEKDSSLEKSYISSNEEMDDNFENSNSLSNMDLTCYEERNMQESIDTGYASVTRDTDSMSSHDDVCTSSELDLEWDNDPTTRHLTLDYRLGEDSLKPVQRQRSRSLDHGCSCNKKRSRSLADIEISLDEKVTRLREEKLYVQRKIREAIEEEQIRHQQLKVFRSLSPVNRKELLVKTLNDLKTRLENQSTRLQASYDMVLSLQKKFIQRRNTLPAIETVL